MGYKIYQTRLQPKSKAILYYLIDLITSFIIKSKPTKADNPKNILIIRNDHIGDVILCSRVFREIKKRYPSSKITALVAPVAKPILEKNPYIDKIIALDPFWRDKKLKSLIAYFKVLRAIKNEGFDVGIDIRGSLLNIIFLLWVPRIKKRVSYFNASGGKAFLTDPIEYEKLEHTIKFDADLVAKGLNFKIDDYWPEIITDDDDEKIANEFLKKHKLKKYICICPGATSKKKQWSPERFDALIKKLNIWMSDYKILICGGNNDLDLINYLCGNKNTFPLINFNLRLLSIIFKKSGMVISNDGGPLQIAWVSGAKALALWGPIDLTTVRPLKKSRLIHHQNKPNNQKNLMDLITVNEVEKECRYLIENEPKIIKPKGIR